MHHLAGNEAKGMQTEEQMTGNEKKRVIRRLLILVKQ